MTISVTIKNLVIKKFKKNRNYSAKWKYPDYSNILVVGEMQDEMSDIPTE